MGPTFAARALRRRGELTDSFGELNQSKSRNRSRSRLFALSARRKTTGPVETHRGGRRLKQVRNQVLYCLLMSVQELLTRSIDTQGHVGCLLGLESSIVEIESRQASRDVISGQSCPLKLWEDFEVLPSYMCTSKLSKQAMCTSKLCMQHARRDPFVSFVSFVSRSCVFCRVRGPSHSQPASSNNEVLHEFLRLIQR